MGKDIDEDLIEATIRRIQAQSAGDPDSDEEEASEAGEAESRATSEAALLRLQAHVPPPRESSAPGLTAGFGAEAASDDDSIEATIRRVQAQAASRSKESGADSSSAPEHGDSAGEEDAIAATIRRVQAQVASRDISADFLPAPLPPLEEDEGEAADDASDIAQTRPQEEEPELAPTAWREQAPPVETTQWPGRDERLLGEPATWEIAAQRLEEGLQTTQREIRALAARFDALMPALERALGGATGAAPSLTVVQPQRPAGGDGEWDDRPRVAPMQFGAPPRPPVFRDPSPQTATAAELVEEPQAAEAEPPAAAAPKLHAIDAAGNLDRRLPRQYRITVEDKRRGVDLVPLHRAMQGLENIKDMSLLSYSNGVAIVLVESVGAIDPEALRAAVERAMSREAKIEVHNEQTMVVKIQEE
ncbi:MAG: hypothetical protein HY873_03035 [Chloroflexi bacterium]|nr:hypothetical protein [Chloroflexota bacterium]